jgi:hypothetical protein
MRAQPERDGEGIVLPHDHLEVLREHHVIRHITERDLHLDKAISQTRIASGAYSESSEGGMSVDIEEWMLEDGLESTHYVTDLAHGAVRLNVGELRELGLTVGWDPLPENPHHGAVWGIGNGSKRKQRISKLATVILKARGQD